MAESFDVVVIGGGVTGASAAWQLARRRARVLLLERDQLASGGTGRSTAVIRTHYTHELLARMALEARRFFENFNDVVGGDCGFRKTGFLVLSPPADCDATAANVAMHRRLGIEAAVMAPHELREIEPRLATDHVGAAAWEPNSGVADPHGTTAAFAAAARRHGAHVRTEAPAARLTFDRQRVTGVATAWGAISAGTVLVAAGFASRELLRPLGVQLPVTPVRHPIAVLRRSAAFGPPHPIISDRVLGSYYMPEGRQLSLVGTTAPFDGVVDADVHAERLPAQAELERLGSRFLRRFPAEDVAQYVRGWTGVYDCTPDLQPILGAVPGLDGVRVAAGFSGHGFKLSPVIGEMLAESILEGSPGRFDPGFFSLARFTEQRPIVAAHAYSVPTLG